MLEGIIVKGYSGFYYVQSGSFLWECSLRGKYRIKDQDFLVGDRVLVKPLNDSKAVIEKVLTRTNQLIRPPVANVEQVVIVVSLANPDPDLMLLDRILVLAEHQELKVVICFNKADLVDEEYQDKHRSLYESIGYDTLLTSVKTMTGISRLLDYLKGKISVMAGPSGVGKSSILNAIQPGLALKTGRVSQKTKRGRHTTRHVELMGLEAGGFVADTPGFSRLDLPEIKKEDLSYFFPEMAELKTGCRFTSCLHQTEPGCAVLAAKDKGSVDMGRYENYSYLLNELIRNERRY
jgi:ribosome biogenesis GTPase